MEARITQTATHEHRVQYRRSGQVHWRTHRTIFDVEAPRIRGAHVAAGKGDPTADPRVAQVVAGVQRQHAKDGRAAPKRAKGLSAEVLAAIRATACQPRSRSDGRTESPERAKARGLVDIALTCLGRDALLRRGRDEATARALPMGDRSLRSSRTSAGWPKSPASWSTPDWL